MARRTRETSSDFGHMSFIDILANTIGALAFLFLMFFVVTSALITPTALTLLTSSLPDATSGQEDKVTLPGGGGSPPYNWKINRGYLPDGFKLDAKSGVISGVSVKEGEYSFEVRLKGSKKPDVAIVKKNLKLLISPPSIVVANTTSLRINTEKLPSAIVGNEYEVTLSVVGGEGPYAWISAGELPLGLEQRGDRIFGVPKKSGEWRFEIRVTDRAGATDGRSIDLRVTAEPLLTEANVLPVSVTTKEPPAARVGEPYELVLAAAGGVPPYSWFIMDGQLPAGLVLDAKTGGISGIPEEAQDFEFKIGVTDSRDRVNEGQKLSVNVDDSFRGIPSGGFPLAWWLVIPVTMGATLGLFLLFGVVAGVQCPWDKSWGCKVIGKDDEGRAIYLCKHGHKFVNEIKEV